MKICCKCCVPRPRDDFNVDRRKRDGLQSACRSCMSTYQKARRRRSGFIVQRKHRVKYEGHDFVVLTGVLVRKLSARELAEFRKGVEAEPVEPIRLDVAA